MTLAQQDRSEAAGCLDDIEWMLLKLARTAVAKQIGLDGPVYIEVSSPRTGRIAWAEEVRAEFAIEPTEVLAGDSGGFALVFRPCGSVAAIFAKWLQVCPSFCVAIAAAADMLWRDLDFDEVEDLRDARLQQRGFLLEQTPALLRQIHEALCQEYPFEFLAV